MPATTELDLIIVGGGIGGVICLKYARDAGLRALLLERAGRVGGIWRDLPPWQDIQFRKEDWTLGDVPIDGVDQGSILRNIEAWVDRFGLAPMIRLNSPVTDAKADEHGWSVTAGLATFRCRYLVAANGGHGRPQVPAVERVDSEIDDRNSWTLASAEHLCGRRVTVVGGGASAYDLLDLCFDHGARSIAWAHRSTKWMRPTLKPKHLGNDMRQLAKLQMLGLPVPLINWLINRDLRARYAKSGLLEIMPDGRFDLRRHQLIPGRRGMVRNFDRIERHRAQVQALRGRTVCLSDGAQIEADRLLWGTGYTADFDFLGVSAISSAGSLNELGRRCYSGFRSMDAPNLFLLAPAVLETNTSTPWAYAHGSSGLRGAATVRSRSALRDREAAGSAGSSQLSPWVVCEVSRARVAASPITSHAASLRITPIVGAKRCARDRTCNALINCVAANW